MHELRGLLGSILATIAPLSVLNQGVQDVAGELGVYVSLLVGGIGLWRLVVVPLQKVAARVEQIPDIQREQIHHGLRLSSLERGLGVTPPTRPDQP